MLYNEQELSGLWEVLQDKKNLFVGKYTGLVEVAFELPLDEFRKQNREHHIEANGEMETRVSTDVPEAMRVLRSVDIRCHHLSCAADVGMGDNTALCIHYLDPINEKYYALTFPGINYIPAED